MKHFHRSTKPKQNKKRQTEEDTESFSKKNSYQRQNGPRDCDLKNTVKKPCIPSCHIKTATIGLQEVKFLNVVWNGFQKDWNNLKLSRSQVLEQTEQSNRGSITSPVMTTLFVNLGKCKQLGKSPCLLIFKEERRKDKEQKKNIQE